MILFEELLLLAFLLFSIFFLMDLGNALELKGTPLVKGMSVSLNVAQPLHLGQVHFSTSGIEEDDPSTILSERRFR